MTDTELRDWEKIIKSLQTSVSLAKSLCKKLESLSPTTSEKSTDHEHFFSDNGYGYRTCECGELENG